MFERLERNKTILYSWKKLLPDVHVKLVWFERTNGQNFTGLKSQYMWYASLKESGLSAVSLLWKAVHFAIKTTYMFVKLHKTFIICYVWQSEWPYKKQLFFNKRLFVRLSAALIHDLHFPFYLFINLMYNAPNYKMPTYCTTGFIRGIVLQIHCFSRIQNSSE